MAKLLQEELKVDQAIAPAAAGIAPAAMVISRFFPMGRERKAMAVVHFVSTDLERTDAIDIGIVDDSVVAPAASGDLALLVAAADPGVLANDQIVAGVGASVLAIDVTLAADGALTINGVVFPYAAIPALPGEWSSDAELVAQILALLPALNAVAEGANIVRIEAAVPGEATVTLVSTVTLITDDLIVTRQAVAYLEIDAAELVPGATTIAVVIDNVGGTGTINVGAALVRGNARYMPVPQAVA